MMGLSAERGVTTLVAIALFMSNLDGTIIATALPAIARGFGEDAVHMNVALTAYLFAVALFVPASGWLADRYGTRMIFSMSVAVFTVGSVLCGLAPSLGALIAARVIQGAGGALMLPVGRLVLLRAVPRSRLVDAMAWVTMPALVGPVIGPPLGGLIIGAFSWHWIFYINLPIGVAGLVAAMRLVPDFRGEAGPLDAAGLVLSGLALAALLALLELLGRGIVGPAGLAGIAGAGVLAGALYAWRSRGRARPVLDFSLMRLPTFAVSVLAGSLFRFGVGAVPFLLPMLLQVGFGRTPLQSGLTTFAVAVGAVASKPASVALLRRFGFRRMLVVNGAASGLGIVAYAAIGPHWPAAALYGLLLVTGYLRSLQFTSYNAIAYAEVPPARMSAATTLYSVLQQISVTVGVPLSAAILQLTHIDFAVAFLVVGGIATLAGPAGLLLPRGAGAELAGG